MSPAIIEIIPKQDFILFGPYAIVVVVVDDRTKDGCGKFFAVMHCVL